MKLLELEYDNLFSLGKGSISLESLGLTLVTGFSKDEGSSNGSGKSSLANKAVLWTLFGETAGGLRADAVINIHGKKSCVGKLTFQATRQVKYRIERRRPAKLSLFKDDIDISAHTAKETQVLIDSLLGFDFETFVQTSVFGQGRLAHYPSLSPKQRKEVLENILPMEQADEWAEFTDKAIKKLAPKCQDSKADAVAAQSNLSTIQRVLEGSARDGEEFEAQRAFRISGSENDVAAARSQFQTELDGIEATANILRDFDCQANIDKIELMEFEAGTWVELQVAAEEKWYEAQRSLTLWDGKTSGLENIIAKLKGSSVCMTCERPFDDSTVEAIERALADKSMELASGYEALQQAGEACTYFYEEQKKWTDKMGEVRRHAQAMRGEIEEYRGLEIARELVETKISSATAGAQARLDVAKNETNPHVAVYERHFTEEQAAQEHLTRTEHASIKLNEELDHLKYWKQVYGKDLKLKLFEDACPFLDSRTQYHLGRLGNQQIHCDFSTIKRLATGVTKEEFDVVVWSETGGRGFEALSGGEQQIVSFAIGLSLADIANRVGGSESGFLVLDEPFTELDERNEEAVISYLQQEVEGGRDTVLLISNEESLKGLIHNRIHVVKKAGISNVDQSE